jgi:hypothetical protein
MSSGARGGLVSTMQRFSCDARTLPADAAAVDALCRLQLAVRRLGCALSLRHVSVELCELIELAGLAEVLRVEPQRQAEEREERPGVEEERELGDPAA